MRDSKKSSNFAIVYNESKILSLAEAIEQSGIIYLPELRGFDHLGQDFMYPYIVLMLCLRGSARAMYDLREVELKKNELAFVMPGHILRPLECSEDLAYALCVVSPKMFEDLKFQTFSHDYKKFNYSPCCSLTEEQAQQLRDFVRMLMLIVDRTEEELPHRRQAMLAQLAIGYEFLNFFRREQDKHLTGGRFYDLYNRFCELVVQHYRESKEIKFYADLLHLTPKYFSKVIRQTTNGMSPGEWIEQYVVAQAKRLIESHPSTSLKEIAYMLGFQEPSSFHRYFKRVTGITALEYRSSI